MLIAKEGECSPAPPEKPSLRICIQSAPKVSELSTSRPVDPVGVTLLNVQLPLQSRPLKVHSSPANPAPLVASRPIVYVFAVKSANRVSGPSSREYSSPGSVITEPGLVQRRLLVTGIEHWVKLPRQESILSPISDATAFGEAMQARAIDRAPIKSDFSSRQVPCKFLFVDCRSGSL